MHIDQKRMPTLVKQAIGKLTEPGKMDTIKRIHNPPKLHCFFHLSQFT